MRLPTDYFYCFSQDNTLWRMPTCIPFKTWSILKTNLWFRFSTKYIPCSRTISDASVKYVEIKASFVKYATQIKSFSLLTQMCMFVLPVPTHTTKTVSMNTMQNVFDVPGEKIEKCQRSKMTLILFHLTLKMMMMISSSFESFWSPPFVYPIKAVIIDNLEVFALYEINLFRRICLSC